MAKKSGGMFGEPVTASDGTRDDVGFIPRNSQELNAKYAKHDKIVVRASKYPKHRHRTVRGFTLLQEQQPDGSWRYSSHGETGHRVNQLRGQGHGRALDKALK